MTSAPEESSEPAQPAPIEARAQEAIERIMAGGDLSEITLSLSNGYTDEQVSKLKKKFGRSHR